VAKEVLPVVDMEAARVANTAAQGEVAAGAPAPNEGRPAEGAAAHARAAALPAGNQHVVGQVDGTHIDVDVDPSLVEEAKERCRGNKVRLLGVDPCLLLGEVDVHNLGSMTELQFEHELN
jgi:hypothetical protein